jgi:hypothetical protein
VTPGTLPHQLGDLTSDLKMLALKPSELVLKGDDRGLDLIGPRWLWRAGLRAGKLVIGHGVSPLSSWRDAVRQRRRPPFPNLALSQPTEKRFRRPVSAG